MIPLAVRMIWAEKGRFAIAAFGIGFTVMLILFLLGVYQGVKSGAKSYVLHVPAEVWVSQRNARNLIKTSSLLPASVGDKLRKVEGVKMVEGVLRTIAPAEFEKKTVTLFIFGFDPQTQVGAPKLIEGTANLNRGEIILDGAFAASHDLEVGDSLQIQGNSFQVAGISTGTNLIVGQFGFTTLQDAQKLLGLRNIRSFYLLQLDPSRPRTLEALREEFPNLLFIQKEEFAQNNVEEMEIGVLPILGAIVVFGSISGATVIVLMMYTSVLEKREDYAMLKAVGASHNFLGWLVIRQSILISAVGFAIGSIVVVAIAPVLSQFIPALLLVFTWQDAAVVFAGALVIGAIGAWTPIRTLNKIYPGEVFRA